MDLLHNLQGNIHGCTGQILFLYKATVTLDWISLHHLKKMEGVTFDSQEQINHLS